MMERFFRARTTGLAVMVAVFLASVGTANAASWNASLSTV